MIGVLLHIKHDQQKPPAKTPDINCMAVSVVTNETLNHYEKVKFERYTLMNPLCLFAIAAGSSPKLPSWS